MTGQGEVMNIPEMSIEGLSLTPIHIGNLESTVTEDLLNDYFKHFGALHSIKVCKDETERPLGYGYINFYDRNSAEKAIKVLNFTLIRGKHINISFSFNDPNYPRNPRANLFVKNLPKAMPEKDFYHMFVVYGDILSTKIQRDDSGESKGFGFVQFKNEESASRAVKELNGKLFGDGSKLFVGPFLSRADKEMAVEETVFTNLYVKNLWESATDVDLISIFGMFGTIKSAVVMMNDNGKSKGFGFVDFEHPEEAARAVDKLNGEEFKGRKLYVGRALKRKEREPELRVQNQTTNQERSHRTNNLYVKNLGDEVDDDTLKEWFSPFGTIVSCKVMRNENGLSKGFGFVAFRTSQEASRGIEGMKGKMIGGKPLYVAVAEKKEDRQSQLQAVFANNLPHSIMPIFPPHMYHFRNPPSPAPVGFYGQALPVVVPHMPPVRYSSQLLVPIMRPMFQEVSLLPVIPREPLPQQTGQQGNVSYENYMNSMPPM